MYKVKVRNSVGEVPVLPLISVRELLSRSNRLLVRGTSTLKLEANLVNEALDSGKVIIVDPCSTRRALTNIPEIAWRILGWNASLRLVDLLENRLGDEYFMIPYLVEIFSAVFDLSPIEVKVLTEAFVELVDSGSERRFSDLADKVEEISSTLPYSDKVRVTRLINLLQLLNLGRAGAALSNDISLSGIDSSMLLDLSLVPWKFKELVYGLLMIWCVLRGNGMLLFGEPPCNNVTDIIKVLVDLMTSIGSNSKLIISGVTQNQVKAITNECSGFELLGEINTESGTRWTYTSGSGEMYEVVLEELPLMVTYVSMPEQVLKPVIRVKITLLEKVFRRESEMAYKALAFLREGATTRDGLVSYLTYAFSIKTSHALRLVTKLIAYGLVEEVVGRDTKYWMRLTIRGYSALEEYEALKGGEEVVGSGN